MANNRNSSSSSFYGINDAAKKRGSTFKSNSNSTFDIFDINVKGAQKKTSQVFDFVKKKSTEYERASIKSTNRIFNNVDTRIKKSADLYNKSFSEVYSNLDKLSEKHIDNYVNKMSAAIDKVFNNAKSKYSSLFKDIDTPSTNSPVSLEKSSTNENLNTSNIAKEIANKLSSMKIQCICSCGGKNSETTKRDSDFLKKLVKSGNDQNKSMKDLTDSVDSNNDNTSKFSDDLLDLGQMVLNTITNIFGKLLGIFTEGAQKFAAQYEASYNQISTSFATDRKQTYDLVRNGLDYLDRDLNGIVNYASDFLPALEAVSKQGLMGDNALAKAIRDSVDKKIMPWLETADEHYVNMNTYLNEGNLRTLKGQQLMLQNTQNGNRLLQSGVINSLTSDIEPLLRDVEFNTGTKQIAGYEKLMESMVNQGFTEREAYDYARQLSQVQKDQFAALQSGDASQIVAAQVFAEGGSVDSVVNRMSDVFGNMLGQASNDIAVGAMKAGLGSMSMAGDTMTIGRAKAFSKALSESERDLTSIANRNDKEFLRKYDEAERNANQKLTVTQAATNKIENAASSMYGLLSTQIPLFWTWAGSVLALLSGIGKWGANKLIGKLTSTGGTGAGGSGFLGNFGKLFTTSGSAALQGSSSTGLQMLGGLGKGGITAGGASTATAATVGAASLIAGAVMMGIDASKGAKKSKEWFGSNSTSNQLASGAGAALAGAGPGIGQGSAGATAKNIGVNTLKGAAVGAGIGSFIPGVGTAVGAGVGAGVGAVTGAIGGERVAKFFKAAGKKYMDFAKAMGKFYLKVGKGLLKFTPAGFLISKLPKEWKDKMSKAAKKLASAASSIIKKTPIGKIGGKIFDAWKDDNMSLGDKIKTTFKILMDNPLFKFGKKLAQTWVKGFKEIRKVVQPLFDSLKKAAKNIRSKIEEIAGDLFKNSGTITAKLKPIFKKALEISSEIRKVAAKIFDAYSKTVGKINSKIFKFGLNILSKDIKGLVIIIETTINVIDNAYNRFKKLQAIGKKIGTAIYDMVAGTIDNIESSVNKAMDKISNSTVGKIAKGTAKRASGVAKTASGFVKGWFASGSDEIPYDGYHAILHKGETVFNKTATRNIKKLFGITGKSVGMNLTQGNAIATTAVSDMMSGKSPLMELFKKSLSDIKISLNDERIVKAIENSTVKIVKAITSDSSNKDTKNRLKQMITKVKVSYDDSIVKMEPLPSN